MNLYVSIPVNNYLFSVINESGEESGLAPSKKLDDLIHLAELCVDLLQQNEEHYAEVRFFNIYFKDITVMSFLVYVWGPSLQNIHYSYV